MEYGPCAHRQPAGRLPTQAATAAAARSSRDGAPGAHSYLIAVIYLIDGGSRAFTCVHIELGSGSCAYTDRASLSSRTRALHRVGPSAQRPHHRHPPAHPGAADPARVDYFLPQVGFMFALLLFIGYSALPMRSSCASRSSPGAFAGFGIALVVSGQALRIAATRGAAAVAGLLRLTLWRCIWLAHTTRHDAREKRGRECPRDRESRPSRPPPTDRVSTDAACSPPQRREQRAARQKTPLSWAAGSRQVQAVQRHPGHLRVTRRSDLRPTLKATPASRIASGAMARGVLLIMTPRTDTPWCRGSHARRPGRGPTGTRSRRASADLLLRHRLH